MKTKKVLKQAEAHIYKPAKIKGKSPSTQRYKISGQREANKRRNIKRHLKRFANDKQAEKALVNVRPRVKRRPVHKGRFTLIKRKLERLRRMFGL